MWAAETTYYCRIKRYWCDHVSCSECEKIMKERLEQEKAEKDKEQNKQHHI